jgi:hypothetical protein
MKCALVVSMALICASCATTREEAVSIASRELAKRNLSPPKNSVVTVVSGERIEEPGIVPEWVVRFTPPHARRPLYLVVVDQHDRNSVTFLDYSKTRPPLFP